MSKSDQENPNTNCLEGMACPQCGSYGPFDIHATRSNWVTVHDDGTEDLTGDTQWEDHSGCRCGACSHEASVAEFKGQNGVEKIQGAALETLFAVADQHAADTGESDMAVGDLQSLLRQAWTVMSDEQKRDLIQSSAAQELRDIGGAGSGAEEARPQCQKLGDQQESAIRCAVADLIGAVQTQRQHDPMVVFDCEAAVQTLHELKAAFPGLVELTDDI